MCGIGAILGSGSMVLAIALRACPTLEGSACLRSSRLLNGCARRAAKSLAVSDTSMALGTTRPELANIDSCCSTLKLSQSSDALRETTSASVASRNSEVAWLNDARSSALSVAMRGATGSGLESSNRLLMIASRWARMFEAASDPET